MAELDRLAVLFAEMPEHATLERLIQMARERNEFQADALHFAQGRDLARAEAADLASHLEDARASRDKLRECLRAVEAERDQARAEVAELREALELVLPLAASHAAKSKVESSGRYVSRARKALERRSSK